MILSRDEKGEQNVTNITLLAFGQRVNNKNSFLKIGLCSFIFELTEFKLVKTCMNILNQTTEFYLA